VAVAVAQREAHYPYSHSIGSDELASQPSASVASHVSSRLCDVTSFLGG